MESKLILNYISIHPSISNAFSLCVASILYVYINSFGCAQCSKFISYLYHFLLSSSLSGYIFCYCYIVSERWMYDIGGEEGRIFNNVDGDIKTNDEENIA